MDLLSSPPSDLRKRCLGQALYSFFASGVFAVEAIIVEWSSETILSLDHFCYRLDQLLRYCKEKTILGENQQLDLVILAIESVDAENYRQIVNYTEAAASSLGSWLKSNVPDLLCRPEIIPEDFSPLVQSSARLRALLKAIPFVFFPDHQECYAQEIGYPSFCRAPLHQMPFGKAQLPEKT